MRPLRRATQNNSFINGTNGLFQFEVARCIINYEQNTSNGVFNGACETNATL